MSVRRVAADRDEEIGMTASPPSQDRHLTRSRDDRLLGGVAGGVAAFLGIDATLVRIGFVLLAVFGGSGVVLYLALWLLVPPADDRDRPADANLRAGVGEMRDAATGLVDDVRRGWRQDDGAAGPRGTQVSDSSSPPGE